VRRDVRMMMMTVKTTVIIIMTPHGKTLSVPVFHKLCFSGQSGSRLWARWPHLHLVSKVNWVGGWVLQQTSDVRKTVFVHVFQALSVVVQRYNSVFIYESFRVVDLGLEI